MTVAEALAREVVYKVHLRGGECVDWRENLAWPTEPWALLQILQIDDRGLVVDGSWYPAHAIQRIDWEPQ